MFDSLHLTFMLKTICEEHNIEVLPDTLEITKDIHSFKTNLIDFRNSVQNNNIKQISFFTVEPLLESINFSMNNDFIVRCVVK